MKATLGVLGVLRCRGPHSGRYGYSCLYSGALGKGFKTSGQPILVNEVKGRVMSGLDILADHYKI